MIVAPTSQLSLEFYVSENLFTSDLQMMAATLLMFGCGYLSFCLPHLCILEFLTTKFHLFLLSTFEQLCWSYLVDHLSSVSGLNFLITSQEVVLFRGVCI